MIKLRAAAAERRDVYRPRPRNERPSSGGAQHL